MGPADGGWIVNVRREHHLQRDERGFLTRECAARLFGSLGLGVKSRTNPNGSIVVDAPCVRCSKTAPYMLEALVGEPEGLCADCAAEMRMKREARQAEKVGAADPEWFRMRLARAGLEKQVRICEALGITVQDPKGALSLGYKRGAISAAAVTRYLAAGRQRGVLILSGLSGAGKSTAAAFAAWSTAGWFSARSVWSTVPEYGATDRGALEAMTAVQGILVLDEVLRVTPSGMALDTKAQCELVFTVAQERHEAGLGTILTTQSTKDDLTAIFGTGGEQLLRRARAGHDLAGVPETGGFVECSLLARPSEDR